MILLKIPPPRIKNFGPAFTPDRPVCKLAVEGVWAEATTMPNLIRYLLGRLRGAVSDRRRAPRYDARLFFSVSIIDQKANNEGARPPQTLVGRTRNLSETGVGLVVPSLSLGTGHLNDENSTLRLTLDLPAGKVEVQVVPVRSHQLDEGDKESGYFIGARITHMSDEARAGFTAYLRGLRSPH